MSDEELTLAGGRVPPLARESSFTDIGPHHEVIWREQRYTVIAVDYQATTALIQSSPQEKQIKVQGDELSPARYA